MTDSVPLVVHVIHRLGIGGLENGLVNLVNNMPHDRYRHAIVCLAGYSDFANRLRCEAADVFDLEKAPGKNPSYLWRLFKLLRSLRPDIVHTRNIGTLDCQFVAAAAGVRHRIHGEHGWELVDLHGRQRKHIMLRRLSRSVVDRYMTVSRHMGEWLKNVIGIPEARTTQIYNGIDSEKFRPGDQHVSTETSEQRNFVIGTCGRLDPIKDQITLLRAFVDLLKCEQVNWPHLQLVIVGEGGMREQLEEFVERNDLSSRVALAGASDDVAAILRSFDVFVLPSLNEGISNTILEAMATGLPVLATDVGGNPELVVEGSTGSLFAPGDVKELANLLCALVECPRKRKEQGQAGRDRAKEYFSMESMTAHYLEMYDNLTGRRCQGSPKQE